LSPIPSCEAVPPPPRSTPCPYTTLFRSDRQGPDPGATPGRGHRCTVRAVGADAPRSRGLPGRGLPLGTVAPRHPTRGQARRGGGDRGLGGPVRPGDRPDHRASDRVPAHARLGSSPTGPEHLRHPTPVVLADSTPAAARARP